MTRCTPSLRQIPQLGQNALAGGGEQLQKVDWETGEGVDAWLARGELLLHDQALAASRDFGQGRFGQDDGFQGQVAGLAHAAGKHKWLDEACPWLCIAPALGDFHGKDGELGVFYGHPDLALPRVMLVGLGKEEELDLDRIRNAIGSGMRKARDLALESVIIFSLKNRHKDRRGFPGRRPMSLKSDFHIELRHSAVIMIIYNDIQTKNSA